MPLTCVAPPTTLQLFWTRGYRPFILGGSVHYNFGAMLPATGPHYVGRGYSVFVAESPDGQKIVCEEKSGAIVGNDLEKVRLDIKTGDPKIMKQQVAQALLDRPHVERRLAGDFWAQYQVAVR